MLWEELTAKEFTTAVARSEGVCLLPIGVMERHGDHLPLGTDLYLARAMAKRAAVTEPAVVFPPYYFSQIFEAMHQPGTFAMPSSLLLQMLQAVCDEIARNGLTRILIINGHGGNTSFLRYFCQTQLERPRAYQVYFVEHQGAAAEVVKEMGETRFDWHGAEWETSQMLAVQPQLVQMDVARSEPPAWGEQRLSHLQGAFTGIFWYANFPDHYAGDAAPASAYKGERWLEMTVAFIVDVIRRVKADSATASLQERFFAQSADPLYRNQRGDQR